MLRRYVIDTGPLIQYFPEVFGEPQRLSAKTYEIIDRAIVSTGDVLLSIPSIVFVEIFEKWFVSEEFAKRFHYDVFLRLVDRETIEIKPIDQEVMENLLMLDGPMNGHDLHDKIILASAMMLDCPLITQDQHIIDYVRDHKVIPSVCN